MILYDEGPKDYNKTTDEINDKYGPREGSRFMAWVLGALLLAIVAVACWLVWG